VRLLRYPALALTLVLSLFLAACGAKFAQELRIVLAASGPLIQSLPLSDTIKNGLVVDFTDLASGAANLKVSLDACGDKPCKLNAVDTYERLFESVSARGHFGSHEKLQNIQRILRGIIESARVYYGAPPQFSIAAGTPTPTKSISDQIKELKAVMEVK